MSDPTMEATLLTQCLDFSRQLLDSKMSFKINIKFGSGFNFNLSTLKDNGKTQSNKCDKKNKSPSTRKRDAARKQKFLEAKKQSFVSKQIKCDLCDYEASSENGFRKHMDKTHKVIPQLDGHSNSAGIYKPIENNLDGEVIYTYTVDKENKKITDAACVKNACALCLVSGCALCLVPGCALCLVPGVWCL